MNETEARAVIARTLRQVAPEADLDALDADVDWREQLDIDSINLLDFLAGLEEAIGVPIPERDYPKVATLHQCIDYVVRRTGREVAAGG